ncbi:MAG: CaiB/BaiF CoA-transferase family protein [Chloroflexota bacterium]|nr:CaiB/BaiF CoA-transferase family protein [Chloroflexota bacterium]
MTLALEGIKILDISRVGIAGFSTMILGDLGAEVIKIETPRKEAGPYLGSSVSPLGEEGRAEAAYQAINRNKKSIALNLHSEQGRQIFYQLAEKTDVIIEGFRPGVVKRMGVDYETIKKMNPRVVYCSISGYGQDGPYRDMPGHDPNYIAIGGALGLIGQPDGPPILPLNYVGDWAGGSLHATIGILVALMARERTGRGQFVDVSMTDGVIALTGLLFARDYFRTGAVPKRGEIPLFSQPFIGVYETRDGEFITLGCMEPHFWKNLCHALGREDFIPYQYTEGGKRDEIFSYFREVFLTKTKDEWFNLLRQKEICIAPVYELNEVFSDPQVLHRQMVVEVDDPAVGKIKQVGIALKFSETPGEIRSTAPILGEHTQEILQNLGYSEQVIDGLYKSGVVG